MLSELTGNPIYYEKCKAGIKALFARRNPETGLVGSAIDMGTAESLQKSIYKMWTLCGIEPELIDYSNMEICNPAYYARPEAIEATYYSWIFTGKEEYYYQGKTMFDSIEKYCQVENGYC